jgi:hypothetical protein
MVVLPCSAYLIRAWVRAYFVIDRRLTVFPLPLRSDFDKGVQPQVSIYQDIKGTSQRNEDYPFHTHFIMAAEQQTLLDQTKQTVADLSTKVAETLNVGSNASVKSKDAPTGGEYG